MSALREKAQSDLDALLKLGMQKDERNAALNLLKTIAKPVAAVLAGVAASGLTTYYISSKEKKRHDEDLAASFKSLAIRNQKFQKNPEEFIQRFGELSVISPTIAKNPTFASKILEKKLTAGFNVDDIHKLTAIEHSSKASHRELPGAAARASAHSALTSITQAFGPTIWNSLKPEIEAYNALSEKEKKAKAARAWVLENINEEGDIVKKSSAQRVGDECLGTMLAERYVLIKQAGLLSEGLSNMGKGLTYFAPALALGGGIELVRQAVESRRNAALEAQADKNFQQMLRSNDKFQGAENKELAQEAFETLKTVAPSLAARPLVAKTFLEFTVGQGQLAPATVQQLAEAEDKIRGIGGKGGFFEELKSSLGGKSGRELMSYKTIGDIEGRQGRKPYGKRK